MKTNNQDSGNRNSKHQSEQEGSGAATQREQQQHTRNTDASFSEQTDVTPPNHKDFPVVGPGKVDFESRPQGRRTARMVGHEPGTEGI